MLKFERTSPKQGARQSMLSFLRASGPSRHITPVTYYRAYQPHMTLHRSSKHWSVVMMDQFDVADQLKAWGSLADSVVFRHNLYCVSRLYREAGLEDFVEACHRGGGKISFDTDDDLTEQFRELEGRGDEFIATLRRMDMVTVSTPHLKKVIGQFVGAEVVVLPNHIDVGWFASESRKAERAVEGLTVGFLGTRSHYGDWHYPMEALRRIKREHPEVNIVVGGYLPEYLKDEALFIRGVPYVHYPKMMRQFDIVLCSLDHEDEFNKSKSAIKALEAMASARDVDGHTGGAVAVCTDIPVYRRVVNNRANGLLTSNDDWYTPVKELITNPRLRKGLAVGGWKWVNKNRDIRTGWRLWARAYNHLLR